MFFHIVLPSALLIFHTGIYLADHFGKECARSSCRVETLNFMVFPRFVFLVVFGAIVRIQIRSLSNRHLARVGKAITQIEAGFQNFVNGIDDKVDNGFGRVLNATGFFLLGVVIA